MPDVPGLAEAANVVRFRTLADLESIGATLAAGDRGSSPLKPTRLKLSCELSDNVEPAGHGRLDQGDSQRALHWVASAPEIPSAQSQNLGWLGVVLRRLFDGDFATIRDAWRGRHRSVRSPVAPPLIHERHRGVAAAAGVLPPLLRQASLNSRPFACGPWQKSWHACSIHVEEFLFAHSGLLEDRACSPCFQRFAAMNGDGDG
jgi:hypothetical protein